MTLYSPLALIALITVPAIIILYMLKQKHEDYTVSSLYLWQQVLKDIEANAPWQKLRRNILMILQIIAMILLSLALAKPYLRNAGANADNVVIVIDTSLSMQAEDVSPSRFESAKKQALSYVTNLRPGTYITLINMGTSAVIEENLSQDKDSITEKIKNMRVTNGAAATDDAAGLIQSIVNQYPGTEVVVFGDEKLNISDIDIRFVNFSKGSDNYAVVLLSHSVSQNGITALSRIANYSDRSVTLPVSLYADGKVFDAKNIDISPNNVANVYWSGLPADTMLLECRIETEDSLDADNRGWDIINHEKTSKVMLVSEKNVFLEKIMGLMSGIELYKTEFGEVDTLEGYDLYIFDGYLPKKLPKDGNIMIFNPTENDIFEVGAEIELPGIQKSDHTLFKYITDFSFAIAKSKKMTVPQWAEVVLNSNEGPLIFCGTKEKQRIVVFGFDIHNTDIPLRPAFPIMMTNALEWLIPSRVKNVEKVYPGQSVEFNLDPKASEVSVVTPAGDTVTLAPPFPAKIFNETFDIGVYELKQTMPEGKTSHYFAVNVPAEQESNLKYSDYEAVKSGEGRESKPIRSDMNLQGIFLWALLGLLIIEWWVYTNDV